MSAVGRCQAEALELLNYSESFPFPEQHDPPKRRTMDHVDPILNQGVLGDNYLKGRNYWTPGRSSVSEFPGLISCCARRMPTMEPLLSPRALELPLIEPFQNYFYPLGDLGAQKIRTELSRKPTLITGMCCSILYLSPSPGKHFVGLGICSLYFQQLNGFCHKICGWIPTTQRMICRLQLLQGW